MSNKVTLGGERLGNGKKIKVDLHGWGRSTFNQSRIWRSTMGVGMLIPCFHEIGLPGTTFNIDINTLGHTIPTTSPLFGSFKLQVDMFACPIRLYQGLLHNNAVNIGLEMQQVLLPEIEIGKGASNTEFNKMSSSSLNAYLGIKGRNKEMNTFSGIRHLAYYDIFKNYYSNKQEENAKAIGNQYVALNTKNVSLSIQTNVLEDLQLIENEELPLENERRLYNRNNKIQRNIESKDNTFYQYDFANNITIPDGYPTKSDNNNFNAIYITGDFTKINFIEIETTNGMYTTDTNRIINDITGTEGLYDDNWRLVAKIKRIDKRTIKIYFPTYDLGSVTKIGWNDYDDIYDIQDFPLENIDDARRVILSKTNLNQKVKLNTDLNFLPYSLNFENESAVPSAEKTFQGLMLKTYQNDIFNCWLNNEFVEKINNLTSITPDSEGNISIDAFILAKKVYNIMNRIAISGGTYQNWQESVYGENAVLKNESPIYIGGTSAEITFEEVVATTKAQDQALGTLGGKGIMANRKGGHIVYKCNEPCLILGIASITPRVDYHQGNDWFMTNVRNMDNLHKPGLDGIGFQDLIENNIVWQGSPNVSLAKQTAWINYQTSYNEVFGQFALDEENEADSLHHMVLRRNYEVNSDGEITDFTSYIDPSKYNYAFADDTLKAQNFWIQIGFNVKSRRKMAANEIPNL